MLLLDMNREPRTTFAITVSHDEALRNDSERQQYIHECDQAIRNGQPVWKLRSGSFEQGDMDSGKVIDFWLNGVKQGHIEEFYDQGFLAYGYVQKEGDHEPVPLNVEPLPEADAAALVEAWAQDSVQSS